MDRGELAIHLRNLNHQHNFAVERNFETLKQGVRYQVVRAVGSRDDIGFEVAKSLKYFFPVFCLVAGLRNI